MVKKMPLKDALAPHIKGCQTRKCIDNTKNKLIHSSSVRGLNHVQSMVD